MTIAFVPLRQNEYLVRRVYTTGAALAIGHIVNGEFRQMPGEVRQLTVSDMRQMIRKFKEI